MRKPAALFRRIAQSLLALGFALALGAYSIATISSIHENWDRAPRVIVAGQTAGQLVRHLRDFPAEFEPFFETRVGWRHLFVRRFSRFKMDRLGVSPTPRIWFGDDGWLFYNQDAEPNYYSANDPRLAGRLEEWMSALPEWRAWLAERNIRLLVVVPPDKQSVYHEHLPPFIRKSRPARSPLDDVLSGWRERDPLLDVLDLRGPLAAVKADHRLYYKTDTHWNPYGARVGYLATAERLGFSPLSDDRFRIEPAEREGDLGFAQLEYWPYGKEPFDNVEPIAASAHRIEWIDLPDAGSRLQYLDVRAWERADQPGTCLLFHDSFGHDYYAKLLAEHFGRLVAVPSNHLDPRVIERERPTVVVFELVERLFQGIGARRRE